MMARATANRPRRSACCAVLYALLLQACAAADSPTPSTTDASDAGNPQPDAAEEIAMPDARSDTISETAIDATEEAAPPDVTSDTTADATEEAAPPDVTSDTTADVTEEPPTPDGDSGSSDRTQDPVDGDAGCTCTMVDDPEIRPDGRLHETTLPCLCMMHFCPTSPSDARAWITNSVSNNAVVKTYQACGLLEFRARIGLGFNDSRWIFDLTNGTLVGQLWDRDGCSLTCGCTTRAGRFPAAGCVVTSTEPICTHGQQPCADGGNDGSGNDGL